ncbi:hypothetical protein FC83_GL000333 [Agrilactobacillus composti DSM 18527 = JCM 14202]|uniref:Preprotein translocase subunit YajC n=2 Tax=Agrilactobacillus TaxID=2767875 RepID=A0A0R1XUT1_9LACO|nr:hypothetical protein FC83_GL000333 [Agrilactobacillus composti DSM 18527 = JCM 14202]
MQLNFLAAGSSSWSFILILVAMGVVMYFSMIRPQKKQQQKRQEMMNQMKKGDKIITIGGLHGVIDTLDNDAKTVVIDSDGVYLTFNLSAIRQVEPTTANIPGVTSTPEAKVEDQTDNKTDDKPDASEAADAKSAENDQKADK